jgi:nitrogenase iron protein NifH
MPIREGYAREVFIVTSGEMMALYAADNIARAVKNFESRGYARVAGLIQNSRNIENENAIVDKAAEEIGAEIVARIPRCGDIQEAESRGGTILECVPASPMREVYEKLADTVLSLSRDDREDKSGRDELRTVS